MPPTACSHLTVLVVVACQRWPAICLSSELMPGPDLGHSDFQAAWLRLETGSQVPANTRPGLDRIVQLLHPKLAHVRARPFLRACITPKSCSVLHHVKSQGRTRF